MTDIRFHNDILIENGDIALIEEPFATGQRIRHRLLTFQGEWFLDKQFGIPYRDEILTKNPRLDVIGAILRSEILKSVDADAEFTAFEASLNNATRQLTLSFSLRTTAGTISDTVTI